MHAALPLIVILKVVCHTQPKAMHLRLLKHRRRSFHRFVWPLGECWNATDPLIDHLLCSPLRFLTNHSSEPITQLIVSLTVSPRETLSLAFRQ